MTDERTTEKLLTAEAVGEMLSLSKRQIFRLNRNCKIPASVRISGSVRWRQQDIERWISLGCPERKVFETVAGATND